MGDWESIFKQQGKVFIKPQEDIKKVIKFFKKEGVRRVLDLGCGSGRHTVSRTFRMREVSLLHSSLTGTTMSTRLTWLTAPPTRAALPGYGSILPPPAQRATTSRSSLLRRGSRNLPTRRQLGFSRADEAEVLFVPRDELRVDATRPLHCGELAEEALEDSWDVLFYQPCFASIVEVQSPQHVGGYLLFSADGEPGSA